MANKTKKMFNLEISEEMRKEIKKEAFEKDVSSSQAVRDILESYFKKKNGKE